MANLEYLLYGIPEEIRNASFVCNGNGCFDFEDFKDKEKIEAMIDYAYFLYEQVKPHLQKCELHKKLRLMGKNGMIEELAETLGKHKDKTVKFETMVRDTLARLSFMPYTPSYEPVYAGQRKS